MPDGFDAKAHQAGVLANVDVHVTMADLVNGIDLADELAWEHLFPLVLCCQGL